MSTKTINQIVFGGKDLTTFDKDLLRSRVEKAFKPTHKLVDNSTYVGIEVEVERVFKESSMIPLSNDNFLWKNTEDNSLRNNGREFVSVPVCGDDILYSLSVLNNFLTKDKTCVGHEFTDRTSVHVHMNARTMSVEHLFNFLLTYLLVEPILYRYVGGDRAKNIFCVPITESSLAPTINKALSFYENNRFTDALMVFSRWQKYTGLNLLPIHNYGTVEFRHMVGTKDETILSTWINLIFKIKRYSSKFSYQELKAKVLEINTSSLYVQTLHDIFGELTGELDLFNVEDTLERTSIFIKDCYSISQNDKAIKERLSNMDLSKEYNEMFYEHSCKVGFLKKIDVEVKIRRLLEKIKSYEKVMETYDKEIITLVKSIEGLPENTVVKGIKKRILSLTDDKKAYINAIGNLQAEIDTLRNETQEKSTKSLSPEYVRWVMERDFIRGAEFGVGPVQPARLVAQEGTVGRQAPRQRIEDDF